MSASGLTPPRLGEASPRDTLRAASTAGLRDASRLTGLLVIAYHFPPGAGSSGVLRTLKFCRYLPEFGWKSHVLTVRESVYRVRDERLLSQVPPCATIHRARAWDTARHFAFRGRHLAWMAVPDRYVTWLPFGTFCGLSVARRLRPSAILSTSPYPTAHLIATIIQARTRLPWLADFRDPWIEEGFHPRPGSLRYRIESALERLVLTRADHITVTTPQLRRDLLRRYPYIPPAKISVIYNGFDDDDFADLPAQATPEHFEILHAGLVTPAYRDPGPLLRAIATLIAQGTLSPDHARVVFLGGGQWLCSREFASVLEELRLQSIVQVLPPIPYHAVPERLSRAAVLLLLQASDDTRSLIPAKLFEYLRVGRPVLALCPEGATSDLLHELEFGVVCDPASEDRLRQAVVTLYRSWLRGEPVARPRNLDRFSRRALTAELAALLHELTHRS